LFFTAYLKPIVFTFLSSPAAGHRTFLLSNKACLLTLFQCSSVICDPAPEKFNYQSAQLNVNMRSLALAALLGFSQAIPALVERAPKWVTVTVYEDVYTTVTNTPASTGAGHFDFEDMWAGKQSSEPAPAAQNTAPPPPPPAADTTTWAPPPPPPAATSWAPAPAAPAPAAPASNDYSDVVVYNHNVHRANHSAPDAVWSQSLADTALKIAQSCVYAHNT
jgi:hypothetical protein